MRLEKSVFQYQGAKLCSPLNSRGYLDYKHVQMLQFSLFSLLVLSLLSSISFFSSFPSWDFSFRSLPRKTCQFKLLKQTCKTVSEHSLQSINLIKHPTIIKPIDQLTFQPTHLPHLRGDKVSMFGHTYPHKPLRKIKMTICNHQTDSPLYVWSDVWPGDL